MDLGGQNTLNWNKYSFLSLLADNLLTEPDRNERTWKKAPLCFFMWNCDMIIRTKYPLMFNVVFPLTGYPSKISTDCGLTRSASSSAADFGGRTLMKMSLKEALSALAMLHLINKNSI